VQKAESGWWKRLLRGEGKAPHYVKIDWDKWVDEDEAEEGMHYVSFGFFYCIGKQYSFTGNLIELSRFLLVRWW